MRKHHPDNERVKRRYFLYLREANRLSEATVDQTAAAIAAFEESTGHKDFRRFHIEQAQRFKRVLAEQVNPATGKPLAKATIHSRLMALRTFFRWLCGQPGFRSRLCYSDADYFNPSANDGRIADRDQRRHRRQRPRIADNLVKPQIAGFGKCVHRASSCLLERNDISPDNRPANSW